MSRDSSFEEIFRLNKKSSLSNLSFKPLERLSNPPERRRDKDPPVVKLQRKVFEQ